MKYKKIKEIIDIIDEKNKDNSLNKVLGIKKNKTFFPTVASLENVDLSEYKVIRKNYFACNLMHVGRDAALPIALSMNENPFLVSPAYKTFTINKNSGIEAEYLMSFFQNNELDRYLWFISDVGIRGELKWERFLEVDVPIPESVGTQQSVASTWSSLRNNIDTIQNQLIYTENLISNYFAYISRNFSNVKLENYIEIVDNQNSNKELTKSEVRGISITKEFIKTKAKLDNVDISKYVIVEKNNFAFNPNTARMGEKLPIALNKGEPVLVSTIYPAFRIKSSDLNKDYLFSWFRRKEFDRYVRFHSWGSAREIFSYEEMKKVYIPLPSRNIQEQISNLGKNIDELKKIKQKLDELIENISPTLFAGISIEKI
jgi:type I restriction enzyme, S subunit